MLHRRAIAPSVMRPGECSRPPPRAAHSDELGGPDGSVAFFTFCLVTSIVLLIVLQVAMERRVRAQAPQPAAGRSGSRSSTRHSRA
ncbi:MAG: hypothetical protein ACRD0S_04105 [Acidimicrobiales bacterium]